MGLVSQSIPSYNGGVSQQPNIVRFPNQLEEQINGFSNEVEGLQKRPPTIFLKRLGDAVDPSTVAYHLIERDENEKYILEMSNGNLRVWDLLGNPKTVKFPNGKDYLNVVNPKRDFGSTTVADYTFILNKTKVTEMLPDRTPKINFNKVLMDVKGASYGKTFAIFINGVFVAGVRVPDGSSSWMSYWISTSNIANALFACLKGTPITGNGILIHTDYWSLSASDPSKTGMGWNPDWNERNQYSFDVIGDSVVTVQRNDKTEFNFTLKDGFGGQNFVGCAGEARSLSKLPTEAPDGYTVVIVGETGSPDDDYYLKWDATKKVWRESLAEDTQYKINPQTMPWGLIREADGTFTFKPLEWYDRTVGDEDSNPDPSFIGNTINDIFFYRNRLGFISDESIILSESSSFFNFWFKSVVTLVDTDTIDVSVSSTQVSKLTHAVPFARELMLFSPTGQFVLGSDGVMTPKTVKVDQISYFAYTPDCAPIAIGQNIFFINNKINYCSMMRYFTVQDVADMKDADDVSSHIPTYIPKGIIRLSGNTSENTVTCLSESDPDTLWIYKFVYNGGEMLQSAWSKWQMGNVEAKVLLADFINSDIYVIISSTSGITLEKIPMSGNVTDFSDEPVRLYMDRKIKYTIPEDNTYKDYDNYTVVSFKDIYGAVPLKGTTYYLVDTEGYLLTVTEWDDEGNFKLSGDVRGKSFFVGKAYDFEVTLSKQLIKQGNNQGGMNTEEVGRLQLRYYWFDYSKSGTFDICVENPVRGSLYCYTNTSKDLGVSTTILGSNKTYTGKFRFPVQDNAKDVVIKVISNNPLPLNIISGGWEGVYIRKSQRI